MTFERWVNEVDACLKALSGGKTFSRLSPKTMQKLRQWYDEGMSAESAAQEWWRRVTTYPD